jgi:hypothetical protein
VFVPHRIGGRVHVLDQDGMRRQYMTNIAPETIWAQRIGDAVYPHSSVEAEDTFAAQRADRAQRFERIRIRTTSSATTAAIEAIASGFIGSTVNGSCKHVQ